MTYKKKRIISIAIIIVVILVILILLIIDNNRLDISYYTYYSDKVEEEFEGYTIVQISDLHNASFGNNNERLLERIKSCKPDIIVITGDLVDSNHTNIDVAISFVNEAVKIAEVYYVTGNHELWLSDSEYSSLIEGLNSAGVTVLDNEMVRIEQDESYFLLAGLDDGNLYNFSMKKIGSMDYAEDKLTLLLAHEPQCIKNYAREGADLVLTGHAHGGQIRLPFIGAVYAPDQGFFPKYTEGEYYVDDTEMIVSRGLGNSVLPLRINDRPEIVCIKIGCSGGKYE